MATSNINYSLYNFLLGDSYNEDNFTILTEEDLCFDRWYASNRLVNYFYNKLLHDNNHHEFQQIVLNEFGDVVDTIENEWRKIGILEKHGLEHIKKAKVFYVSEGIENETYREQTSEKEVVTAYAIDFYHDYYEALREAFNETEYHTFYNNQDEEIYFDEDTIFEYMFLYHNHVKFDEYIETLGMITLNPKYKNTIISRFLDRMVENTLTEKANKEIKGGNPLFKSEIRNLNQKLEI